MSNEPDLACLVRVRGRKMRIIGRVSYARHGVGIRTEHGAYNVTPRAVTVLIVESKDAATDDPHSAAPTASPVA